MRALRWQLSNNLIVETRLAASPVAYAGDGQARSLHSHSQRGRQRFADLSWRFRDFEASLFHGSNLLSRSALAAGDDRAGVSHAASRRRSLSGDEADDRLLHMRLDKLRGSTLRVATDFSDHDPGSGLRIPVKKV